MARRPVGGNQLTVVCGADLQVPNREPIGLIERFLRQFRLSVLAQPAAPSETISCLCFVPDAYGAELPIDESKGDLPFELYSLPSPQVPIPSGHDFWGGKASNYYLPFPDAYRTDAIRRAVRRAYAQHRKRAEPLLLHAHTPGVIGFHLRRAAELGRKRGTRLPLVATHSLAYREYLEAQAIAVVQAWRASGRNPLQTTRQGGLLEQIFPQLKEAPEVVVGLEKTLDELCRVAYHWYAAPRNPRGRGSLRWGKFLLYLADKLGTYSHHRLQGSLAIANALTAMRETVSHVVGVPLEHMPPAPTDFTGLFEEAASQAVGQLVDLYLRYFYSSCDRVLNIEGDDGRKDLERMRMPCEKIVDIDVSGDVARQMKQIYHDISAGNQIESLFQPRTPLANFHWGPPVPGYENATAEAKISDVHLGDGSGSSRASALLAIKKHCARLGIRSFSIIGDLLQRNVDAGTLERHRDMFLAALREVCGTTHGPAILCANMKLDPCATLDSGRREALQREFNRAALRTIMSLDVDGKLLGFNPNPPSPRILVRFVRGNHDDGEQIERIVRGAILSRAMIHHDASSGILECHGNIWSLPELPAALEQARSLEELCTRLEEPRLRRSLEIASVIYSVTDAILRIVQKRVDVRALWKEDIQPALSKIVQWYRDQSDTSGGEGEFSRFLTGVISPADNADRAAQTGVVVRSFARNHAGFCWAVCEGHSHKWGVELRRTINPKTGKGQLILLVNCGKFHGKLTTIALMRFPEVAVFEWDEQAQEYFLLEHKRLTSAEIAAVLDTVGEEPTTRMPSARVESRSRGTLLEICTEGHGHEEKQKAFLPLYQRHGPV